MANRTDQTAKQLHSMNPQFILETIIRNKIYNCIYWKDKCFALTSETIIDAAVKLEYIGGYFGGNQQPTEFLCLTLKLLQIQPDKAIIEEYLINKDYKYLSALAAFYIRLTGRPSEVYQRLEPLFSDFRKLRKRNTDGSFTIIHFDEFLEELFTQESVFEIILPVIPKRSILEENGELGARISILDADLEMEMYEVKEEKEEINGEKDEIKEDIDDEEAMNQKIAEENKNKAQEYIMNESKRWEKVDLEQPESFNREKNFSHFNKKKNKRSRSRSGHRKKSRSRSKSEKRSGKTKDKNERVNDKKEEEKKNEPLDENSAEYWLNLRKKLGLMK